MSRDPRLYLEALTEAVERAFAFGKGLALDAYRPGNMAFEAIVGRIEIIGEASTHLSEEVRALAPGIPWANLIGMRNRLIHGCFFVSTPTSSGTW